MSSVCTTVAPCSTPKVLLHDDVNGVEYVPFNNESQMSGIVKLIEKDLSEPYSIFTYRYFIYKWPDLCILAYVKGEMVGVVICKADTHGDNKQRGYLAMLAVDKKYRKRGIGTTLAKLGIEAMRDKHQCSEAVLETEITNAGALRLYENLGFIRSKRLNRYYLNGTDAFRLKVWFSK